MIEYCGCPLCDSDASTNTCRGIECVLCKQLHPVPGGRVIRYSADVIDLNVFECRDWTTPSSTIQSDYLYDTMLAFGNIKLAKREDWEDILASLNNDCHY